MGEPIAEQTGNGQHVHCPHCGSRDEEKLPVEARAYGFHLWVHMCHACGQVYAVLSHIATRVHVICPPETRDRWTAT